MATAHIGNYGVHEDETESSGPRVAGVVVRNFSSVASRPGGNGTLQDDLEGHNVVGIRDVDTRALVTHIREHGAMNAVVSSDGTRRSAQGQACQTCLPWRAWSCPARSVCRSP